VIYRVHLAWIGVQGRAGRDKSRPYIPLPHYLMRVITIARESIKETFMPIYEYRCLECGQVFSRLFFSYKDTAGNELCSSCGSQQTQRLISSFAIGNRVDPGPGRAAWPTSWDDTNGGDPETLRYWRHRIEREARLEEKYPELANPALLTGKGTMSQDTSQHVETEPSHAHHHHHHEHHHHEHSQSVNTESS
jgi:putative FmdB family regulatory protein